MAAPVVVVSGAMAIAPALMTGPQVHQALTTQTSPGTSTSTSTSTVHLDAVVQTAAVAQTGARTYTVQTGDTLFSIALRYYGQGKYWPGLYQANRSKISRPDVIYTGQVLAVPGFNYVATAVARSTSNQSTSDLSASSTATPSSGGTSTQSSSGGTSTQSSSGGTSTQSSSGGDSAVQSDIADGNNLLALGQYLVDNGYSKVAAAGVVGCVDGESGGNPESVGSGGGGLIGWTPLGSAQPDANIITGDPSQDMMTQLADILFYNSNEIGSSFVDELNSQTDPVSAADFYSQHFEKPAVTDSDVVPSVAEQIFSELGG
jgi:LysM repeat protein